MRLSLVWLQYSHPDGQNYCVVRAQRVTKQTVEVSIFSVLFNDTGDELHIIICLSGEHYPTHYRSKNNRYYYIQIMNCWEGAHPTSQFIIQSVTSFSSNHCLSIAHSLLVQRQLTSCDQFGIIPRPILIRVHDHIFIFQVFCRPASKYSSLY
jgi:hypothetical protein